MAVPVIMTVIPAARCARSFAKTMSLRKQRALHQNISPFGRLLCHKDRMADPAGFEIVTYQRQPGLWRASVTPSGRSNSGKIIRSIVTPDDCETEEDARKSAMRAIKNIDSE